MPLDKSITKFYPFVGLKFNKDAVRILPQKNNDKNKGFFGFFKSAIKWFICLCMSLTKILIVRIDENYINIQNSHLMC